MNSSIECWPITCSLFLCQTQADPSALLKNGLSQTSNVTVCSSAFYITLGHECSPAVS
jgi:hypothetical protein